jgi:hypothetical protein
VRSILLGAVLSLALLPTSVGAVDDGNQIDITFDETQRLVWADDDGYTSWNVYVGDLQYLVFWGEYTQSWPTSRLGDQWCDVPASPFVYNGLPVSGQCAFFLVSGNHDQVEGGLGTTGTGSFRPHTRICHLDDAPPDPPPGAPIVTAGECGTLSASWAPSPSADVVGYIVQLRTTPGSPAITRYADTTSAFVQGLDDATTYYVSVASMDASAQTSALSQETAATTTDTTIPQRPEGLTATPLENVNRLAWLPVVANEGDPPGDPSSPTIHDLAGYRIYRSRSTDVPLDLDHRIAETVASPGATATTYDDAPSPACRHVNYSVTAVDTCGVESASSQKVGATTPAFAAPLPPANVQAYRSAGAGHLSWSAPTQDVDGHPIAIDSYRVERTAPTPISTPIAELQFATLQETSGGVTSLIDPNLPPQGGEDTVYYRVRALDDCPNVSAPSAVAEARCEFSGDVQISPPVDGAIVAGVVPTTVFVTGGTDTYTGVTIRYLHDTEGLRRTYASSTQGTTWTDSGFLASPTGGYTIEATVTSSTGCPKTRSIHVTAGNALGCCVSMFPTTTTVATCAAGSTKCKQVSYRIGNDRCLTPVGLASMTVNWTDYSGNKPRWLTASFNGTDLAPVGSWTTTYDNGSPEHGTAARATFSPARAVPYAVPMTSGNTTLVTYVFDRATDSGSGTTRKVDVFNWNSFTFVLLDANGNPSDVHTTCNMPALTVN